MTDILTYMVYVLHKKTDVNQTVSFTENRHTHMKVSVSMKLIMFSGN